MTIRTALKDLRRLSFLARPYWGAWLQIVLIGIGAAALSSVLPWLSRLLIDVAYPSRDVNLVYVLVLGVLLASLIGAVASGFRSYLIQTTATRLNRHVSLIVFNHVQRLPLRVLEARQAGEVVSRLTDARTAVTSLSALLHNSLSALVYLLIIPGALIVTNWRVAVVGILTLPASAIVAVLSGGYLRQRWKDTSDASSTLSAFQTEVLAQIRTIKGIAAEENVMKRLNHLSDIAVSTQLRVQRASAAVSFASAVLRSLGTAVFTTYAALHIINGQLTVGEFVAFTAYFALLSGPIAQLSGASGAQQSFVGLARIFEFLDMPTESAYPRSRSISCSITPLLGTIQFDSVTYSYDGRDQALRRMTVSLPSNKMTAIVGPSGAGKSSMLRLIAKFDGPTDGKITIGHIPLRIAETSEVRRQIAVVWQDIQLFRGSVWDNLTLGVSDDVSLADVENAVRICHLDELIRRLPHGYSTHVAEWGSTLSGGEKQRIAIARALVKRTPYLLLDEATSHMDPALEEQVLRNLIARKSDQTVIIVTHRPSVAALADHVVVVRSGEAHESGMHADLMHLPSYRYLMRERAPASIGEGLAIA